MTTLTYILCLTSGLLGVLLYLFAVKIPIVKASAKVANMEFHLKQYFEEDTPAIASSIITVLLCVVFLDEIIGYKPEILPYLKFMFAFIGYTGSSLIVNVFGKAQDKINQVINIKTDLLDFGTTQSKEKALK